jgi:phosphoglycolate phosphatase
MSARIEAIVFDLDGTLIDSAPDLCAAANHILEAAGRPTVTVAAITRMVGDGMPKLIERAFAATGAPPTEAEMPALFRSFLAYYQDPGQAHLTTAYPGVAETLAALRGRGLKLGICTNKSQEPSLGVLEKLGLGAYFDAVVGGDVAPRRKPDPAHPRATLKALGVTPDGALMVGDSPNDVQSGQAAGLPVIAVSYGYRRVSMAALGADAIIDRFADLLPAMDRLAAPR